MNCPSPPNSITRFGKRTAPARITTTSTDWRNPCRGWQSRYTPFAAKAPAGKKILFFATLHYWVEQSAVISLVLAGLGHKVTLLTLPYSEWHKKMDKLTQRQRVLHTRDALSALPPLVEHLSFLDLKPDQFYPSPLKPMWRRSPSGTRNTR